MKGGCKMSENTASRDDWELSRGQYDYLHGERLYRKVFDGDDHVHCELCWQTIEPTDHEPSYCTTDERLWICEKCFLKYRKLLGWYVAPEEGEQMYIGTDIPKTCELLPKLKEAADGTDRKYLWALGYENDENAVLFGTDDLARKKETEAYIALYVAERKQPLDWIACYETEKPGVLDVLSYYLARALPTLNSKNLDTMILCTDGAGTPWCHQLKGNLTEDLIGRLQK